MRACRVHREPRFLIYHGVTRQFRNALHTWKAALEILLIARPELGAAPGLATDNAKAVELQLITPFGTFGGRSALSQSMG
jgi:hypothetical protein